MAQAADELVAGTQVEVIGVAENDLSAQGFKHVLGHGLDRAGGADGHKNRRLDGTMRQMHPPAASACLGCRKYVEFKAHQTILPGRRVGY
jgi:hypothetical protein